jgi:nitroreductase
MDVFKCITGRRSIRNFKEREVDKDDLYLLVESAMHAPTSGNLQDCRFIVTTKKEIIHKTAQHCMEQDWISGATGLIAICSQPKLQKEWYGENGDKIFSIQNAAAAAQNILLSAHALGLGACWVSGFDQKEINDLFDTGDARVEVIIPVGYPNEKPDKKVIEEIDAVMFFDKYGNDKSNLTLMNKDYSVILEKELQELPEKSKNLIEKGKYFFKRTIEQIKPK